MIDRFDWTTLILIAALLYFSSTLWNLEEFEAQRGPTQAEFVQNVRELAAIVGPYIGETYTYLRNKYLESFKDHPLPPAYTPLLNDPTLADPLLPIARVQIKAWIDSAHKLWEMKYGIQRTKEWGTNWDLTYAEADTKILTVTYTQNGVKHLYII